ncbi:hypothetical protein H257_13234 [Aphanomyces astaci]|uniref:Uncharacterized protein n=1 Tax=Aphanomyces astaci TaxID=112090 RepID=W4FVN4_APHAT|nr:hypothetical protein H257_13234 [Aphanomyces astaci]ETV71565.1 hypothetical protein H257_13234 [Aphanomyces astaci]|eukprot:XP_009838998.1 hypothetical protein H257_13234 [Aphanomyces astaci]
MFHVTANKHTTRRWRPLFNLIALKHTHITMAKGNAIKEVATAVVLALGAGSIWKSYATSELKSFDEYYKELKIKTDSKATAAADDE